MNHLIQSFGSAPDKIPLICFPFAGGYSASFRPLHVFLQEHCRLLAADPPGHGTNRMPLVENLEKLADLYLQQLKPLWDKPFALFGHSMGGMVAYRLAQKLEQRGIFPQAVIISAVQPPHIKRKPVTHLDDEAFLNHVIGLGGVPSELVEATEVLAFFLPAFRADFKALETFEPNDPYVLQSPVHIFNGEEDAQCMTDSPGWKHWACQIRFHTFPGGHMFLLSETEKVAQTLLSVLASESIREAAAHG